MVWILQDMLMALVQQHHTGGVGHPNAHHPAAVLQLLRAKHRLGMVVIALGKTFRVLGHPIEGCQSHPGGAVFVRRSLIRFLQSSAAEIAIALSCSLLDDKSAINVVMLGLQLICGQAEPASDSRSRSPCCSEASNG